MLTDSQELEITTDSLEAVNAINGFFEQLLSVGNNSQVILKAVEADPTCAIATDKDYLPYNIVPQLFLIRDCQFESFEDF
ncbi:hypothetical protein [Scytonema sp. NUACC26]|uniref:hypothetical protein n=1 Tax=Scytonema sp. NUACC26 TaxID=3140176 RepID=UPI0034DB8B64